MSRDRESPELGGSGEQQMPQSESATHRPALQRIVGEPGSALRGFLVIDEFIEGRGTGGIRLTPDVTIDEVARLAHEMTLKFAWLRLPSGGAKAGIVAPDQLSAADRADLCRAFGDAIGDLLREGRYVGGLDLGTTAPDLREIYAGAGVVHQADEPGAIDSNYFTALTVFAALRALLEVRKLDPGSTTVLVEGLGKVGGHLVELLHRFDIRVSGVSTRNGAVYDSAGLDVEQLMDLRRIHGDDSVRHLPGDRHDDPAWLFTRKADILVPGGPPDSLNAAILPSLQVSGIVPIANICATPEIEEELHRRRIDFIPGFVANCGGVFCWYLGRLGPAAREAMILEGFQDKVKRLVAEADNTGQSLASTARQQARKNLARAKALDRRSPVTAAMHLAGKLSPRRLGYVLGRRILGSAWSERSHVFTRWYFDARYFR